ncbi:SAM-dependent methyltransferase [Streptomyces sp. NPDC015350]|uniref:SAM-dependent methyltransferase n=1 Tax=Streptomyces sp. NPDC015350 TaxID=3364955 RepID=UPI0036F79BDA
MNAPAPVLAPPAATAARPVIAPSAARLVHWLLGGEHHHHPADRLLGLELLKTAPWFEESVTIGHRYAHQTVRMFRDCGVQQFVDLGSGLPTPNPRLPHTSASAGPDATVLHVDADPYVIRHGPGLLPRGTRHRFLHEDPQNMHRILRDLPLHGFDPAQPIAFLLHNVLDRIPSPADARAVLTPILSTAPPGSVISLTHATADLCRDGSARAAANCLTEAGLPLHLRTAEETRDLIEPQTHSRPWHIRAPGITPVGNYHPTRSPIPDSPGPSGGYAAILLHPDDPR